jgi:hypothetical protein
VVWGKTGEARLCLAVKAVGVFGYFDRLSDYAEMVAPDVDYDFRFVKVNAVECLSTANRWFSSLVSLVCSVILVEM